LLQKLLEWAKEKLTEGKINNLLATNRDGKYCLHTVCFGRLDILQKLMEWAKEKLTAEEINLFLLATNSYGFSFNNQVAKMAD